MELYILRHGIAEDLSASGKDRDRALTLEGRDKTRAAGKALRKLEIAFDLVLSSPFVRAWQTAEIVLQELGCPELLKPCEALSSGAPLKGVLDQIKDSSKRYQSVLLVGHEPDLSRTISMLLSGSADLALTMKKGGLAKLTLDAPDEPARLEWLLTPKFLTRLA